MNNNRKTITIKKHNRTRGKIIGTFKRPRLSIFRSNQHIYIQIINDISRTTLLSSSTLDQDVKARISSGNNCEASKVVGEIMARKCLTLGIQEVVFDRGGNLYHGRIKVLADAARETGLRF
uniref:Large ribosomal subunit protein uL18c n=1 Tax=Boldia erythrosiphon TaxID=74908 RepID=A0A1Y9TLW2_9RHOD|nr:50S ribosomal protein L18 [Boldia erythrosiphon]ARO90596.1 50S ribosomal protein L18 [Boldia erythrosiphon]